MLVVVCEGEGGEMKQMGKAGSDEGGWGLKEIGVDDRPRRVPDI